MESNSGLTERQVQILKCIIEEYIETAQAVGSKVLDQKYQLGVSPATIRNEMARLINKGYLKQPHTSAGRVPTPKALKLYVQELMKLKNLSVSEEVQVKEKVWDHRQEFDKLMREAVLALAEATNALAIATTKDNDLYYAGVSNLLEAPEFSDLQMAHNLFEMLDRDAWWSQTLERFLNDENPFYVLMGDDFGEDELLSCGYVFSPFRVGREVRGSIGVIGPVRLNYSHIVPKVEYVSRLISELAGK